MAILTYNISVMNYFIKNFGCQYNEWETARLHFMLQKIGFTETNIKDADIIFINACAVRQTAVDRIYGQIKNHSEKLIIVLGCVLPQDKAKFEARHAHIWDSRNPEALIQILQNYHLEKSPFCHSEESPSCHPEHSEGSPKSLSPENLQVLLNLGNLNSTYLPIMSGCNNFCSYCAVPYTKGRETSRPFDEVVSDFQALVKKGTKLAPPKAVEITLLGQNVNSYEFNFAKLLKTLNNIPGDFQITFTSNHPKDMTDEVIDAIANSKKVKKQIHLPLQSGSDPILKAMNRPYTQKQYLDLVEKIKAQIPNIEFTTDVIVGFPGETEADFQKTVDIFQKVRFFAAYVNKYSPRAGTAAYKLGDPISWAEKQRRWNILNDLAYWKKY